MCGIVVEFAEVFKIGHSQSSETFFPNVKEWQNSDGYYFVDIAGLSDTGCLNCLTRHKSLSWRMRVSESAAKVTISSTWSL